MQLGSIPNYIRQARTMKRIVFFTGSTALAKGMGVCYVSDYTTTKAGDLATDACPLRDRNVAIPSTTNNMSFAGVTAKDYLAVSGGQLIEIFEPGSVCDVAIGSPTTINATVLSCLVSGDPGRFSILQGLPGRGSAIALQTKAAGAGPVLASSLDGTAVCSADGLTITKTALFTNAVVGDRVIVLGGGLATTPGTISTTPGVYTIATRTSADAVILSAACATAANTINALVIGSANPTVLCRLFDGPESGLVQWIQPVGGAITTPMVGGMTYCGGGITIAADSTFTVAAGTFIGQMKGFYCKGALTTEDLLVSIVGLKVVGTALASVEMDAADEMFISEWGGANWCNRVLKGATEA